MNTTAPQKTLEQWAIDLAHSSISFRVRHLVISKVHGRFTRWNGALETSELEPTTSKLEVTIDASSIQTHEPQRDAHLKSPDFLDVEKFHSITFRSTRVERTGERQLRVIGDLTVHGVTRPVTLEVEYAGRAKDPWGGERMGFTAKTSLDRKDFGLVWNQALETGGVLVGDQVEVEAEIEAVKQAA